MRSTTRGCTSKTRYNLLIKKKSIREGGFFYTADNESMRVDLEIMLYAGIVTPSSFCFPFSVVIFSKKYAEVWFCVEYE